MIYEKRLTIPKNTLASAQVSTTFPIHPGVIHQVSVFFPPGTAALAHLTIWLWQRQLWPANPDGDFTGDGELLTFPENLEIVDPPFELTLQGYNLDDTYPHTPIVRVQIDPFEKDLLTMLGALTVGPTGLPTPVEE